MTDHPITPPPLELVHQWADMLAFRSDQAVFTMAAQWGADQELEACCEWLAKPEVALTGKGPGDLRAARRPTPSLKEQALQALAELAAECYGNTDQSDTIRRALEKLDD
jgi:hypothetical protein